MENPNNAKLHHSLRVLRPLFLWFALVLVLFGIRIHQGLMERTRLNVTVLLQNQSAFSETVATLDGRRVSNGQRIPLGPHLFTISNPKAEPFSTNIFTWYGGHDFGRIELRRAMGKLTIQSTPLAELITIRGSDFSTNLSSVKNLVVPIDNYEIEAKFPYAKETTRAWVSTNVLANITIVPRLGALEISSTHPKTTFYLNGRNVQLTGELPRLVGELPSGEYNLRAERNGEPQTKTISVIAFQTNTVAVEFKYGALALETDPSGATVFDENGRSIGITPLTLPELRPGTWRFSLARDNYEPIPITLQINANETNHFQTNLVNRNYATAIRAAQRSFENARYTDAAESAREALKHKPSDAVAISLQREATGMVHLVSGRNNGERGNFSAAILDLNEALKFIPENKEAKQWLDGYTKQQNGLAELERKKEEAQQAEQDVKAKIADMHIRFQALLGAAEDADKFKTQELVTRNAAAVIAPAIKETLSNGQQSFKILRFEQPREDIFILQARQIMGFTYRDCFILGKEVRKNETRILFKVLEYDHPPKVNALADILIGAVAPTNQDPNHAARFQQQIRDGLMLVEERIKQATEKR